MSSTTLDRPPTATTAPHPGPPPAYYVFERPEVIALIPNGAKRILEFGCAAGACGARIKRERGAYVVGVELLPEPAAVASHRLDRVIVGDCEQIDFAEHFRPGQFDAVLFADVLEHLRDPQGVLERIKPYLAENGVVIASIPNARNLAVVTMLAHGDWTYQDAGLMDRTHLRFFTKREIQRMFGRGGYTLERLGAVHDDRHAQWERAGRPSSIEVNNIGFKLASAEDAEELFVYQYLVRARVAPVTRFAGVKRPLVSIVIPARDQLPLTQGCVESIRAFTPGPFEVILVDNGSADGTADWAAATPDVRHIRNDENRGFAAACNQGMAAAKGDYVVLLNNDTIVTPGWLDALVVPMVADPAIGVTGPRSNWVSGHQMVAEAAGYGLDLKAMLKFAEDWALRHRETGYYASRLVGFCIALRRDLIEKIGGLDERFGVGFFEDDDYGIRALLAGFKLWVSNDAFVHHFGNQSFRASKVDTDAVMTQNARKFEEKWGIHIDPGTGAYTIEHVVRREVPIPELRCPLPAAL